MENKLPANNPDCISKVLEQHLHSLHTAREEFIRAESCEKLKRALTKKTRTHNDHVYYSGDNVYFKQISSDVWHGPAKVLGKDGQQYLLKNGGLYVRVHPCRMIPVGVSKCTKSDGSRTPTTKVDSEQNQGNDDMIGTFVNEDRNSNCSSDNETPETSSSLTPLLPTNSAEDVVYGPAISAKDLPKLKDSIMYRTVDQDDWITCRVESRGGKVGGIHWHFMNVKPVNSEETTSISFRDEIREWKKLNLSEPESPEDPAEVQFVYLGKQVTSTKFAEAKKQEMGKWRQMDTYTEEDYNGQPLISSRWICTEKIKGGQLVCKARLVLRGFEEDSSSLQKNSPTCTKDSFRLLLCMLAHRNWELHTIDIKSAFLQGKPISRCVYVKPPKEANTNKIWKLKKSYFWLIISH